MIRDKIIEKRFKFSLDNEAPYTPTKSRLRVSRVFLGERKDTSGIYYQPANSTKPTLSSMITAHGLIHFRSLLSLTPTEKHQTLP